MNIYFLLLNWLIKGLCFLSCLPFRCKSALWTRGWVVYPAYPEWWCAACACHPYLLSRQSSKNSYSQFPRVWDHLRDNRWSGTAISPRACFYVTNIKISHRTRQFEILPRPRTIFEVQTAEFLISETQCQNLLLRKHRKSEFKAIFAKKNSIFTVRSCPKRVKND